MIWSDVRSALGLNAEMPVWQIVKERRATFRATPVQAAKRAEPRTEFDGLYLAGDWTNTHLPATIEGAVRSGQRCAELAARHLSL